MRKRARRETTFDLFDYGDAREPFAGQAKWFSETLGETIHQGVIMKIFATALVLGASVVAPTAHSQTAAVSNARIMPASTSLIVTPQTEISSKHVEVGQKFSFATVGDVKEGDQVVIPRGSPVTGTVNWKTGRAIGGKSGKFEVTFNSVNVGGREYALKGKHRQEGRGNTVGALLGSIWISGKSAVMTPGQEVSIFTAEPIPY
jgi:hypothetical protein